MLKSIQAIGVGIAIFMFLRLVLINMYYLNMHRANDKLVWLLTDIKKAKEEIKSRRLHRFAALVVDVECTLDEDQVHNKRKANVAFIGDVLKKAEEKLACIKNS